MLSKCWTGSNLRMEARHYLNRNILNKKRKNLNVLCRISLPLNRIRVLSALRPYPPSGQCGSSLDSDEFHRKDWAKNNVFKKSREDKQSLGIELAQFLSSCVPCVHGRGEQYQMSSCTWSLTDNRREVRKIKILGNLTTTTSKQAKNYPLLFQCLPGSLYWQSLIPSL